MWLLSVDFCEELKKIVIVQWILGCEIDLTTILFKLALSQLLT